MCAAVDSPEKEDKLFDDKETERRLERAMRRSLAMPPQPHKLIYGGQVIKMQVFDSVMSDSEIIELFEASQAF